MTTETQSVKYNQSSTELRKIDAKHDLKAIADLIEICFVNSLDEDGRKYIKHIRLAADNPAISLMGLDKIISGLNGFVWEVENRIVGNISILPVMVKNQRAYLIANVSVHPDFRRRGIAKKLTQAATSKIKSMGVNSAWLHVSAHNPAAIELYENMGFSEMARRTTWHSTLGAVINNVNNLVKITKRNSTDWISQLSWFQNIYPKNLRWRMNLSERIFRPGISGEFTRMVSDADIQQWAARKNGKLIGTASWQSSRFQADRIWLATTQEFESDAIPALLFQARQELSANRTVSINYPAYRAEEGFAISGFVAHKTLIWMNITL